MESWSISSDGNGNFIIMPTAVLGGGILLLFILGVIKAATSGAVKVLTNFANQYSWLMVLILVILGLVIALFIGISMKKEHLFQSILFGISLPLSLSLIYGMLMDVLIFIAASFEEIFLVTLLWTAPVSLILDAVLAVLVLAMGISPYLIGMIRGLDDDIITPTHNTISIVLGMVAIPLMFFFLFNTTDLPLYLMGRA